jgi:hypothetical protein
MGTHHRAAEPGGASPAGLARVATLDSLPPSPAPSALYAPGDVAPRGDHEQELCAKASHPDWLYMGGLLALNAGAILGSNNSAIQGSDSVPVRMLEPVMLGVTWGALLGGVYLSLPKCSGHWVDAPPREGAATATWPIALSIALVSGATAPILTGIVVGSCNPPQCQEGLPASWSTVEREMHLVAAGIAGFGGALLPYLVPPKTWRAAKELEQLRVGADAQGGVTVQYRVSF